MHMDWTDTAKFWLQEGCTHGFCEKLLKVSLWLMEPVPAGSKMGLSRFTKVSQSVEVVLSLGYGY